MEILGYQASFSAYMTLYIKMQSTESVATNTLYALNIELGINFNFDILIN